MPVIINSNQWPRNAWVGPERLKSQQAAQMSLNSDNDIVIHKKKDKHMWPVRAQVNKP